MPFANNILIRALSHPEMLSNLCPAEWDLLVRQARRADLLARLCILLEDGGLISKIPAQPRNHLVSARVVTDRHVSVVRWEVSCIQEALAAVDAPIILLKGAAYTMAGLPPMQGRLFHDVDIMVPKAGLDDVERALRRYGWESRHLDAYDQRYYRSWMHELPPMRHIKRQTVIDVHHTILPETARLSPEAKKLLDAAQPLDKDGKLRVLAPEDMVLHSATHLFHEGEFRYGLRDIVDLDGLLRHFGAEALFWPQLIKRAKELDLVRPLFYGLRYTKQLLGTPVPEATLKAADEGRPAGIMLLLMDALFSRGLVPHHVSCDDWFSKGARWLLYARSHYLRMPLYLLIPHLVRKALKGDS